MAFAPDARPWWPDQRRGLANRTAIFRADFAVRGAVAGARLRLCAHDAYELRVNGRLVAFGPALAAPPELNVDEWDLAQLLVPGRNLVAVLVHHGGHRGDHGWGGGGLVATLALDDADGARVVLDRAADWRCRIAGSFASDTPRLVGWMGYAEHRRLGTAEDRWWEDDPADGDAPPEAGEPLVGVVWRLRPLPACSPGRRTAIRLLADGDSTLVDFGTMAAGRPELDLEFAVTGVAEVAYIEERGRGWATTEGREAMYADRVSAPAGRHVWRTLHPRACRWMRVSGAAVRLHGAALATWDMPLHDLGRFRCSDPLLDDIAACCKRTLRLCLADAYLDCPHRDRAQWMDAFVSARAALGQFGLRALTSQCLRQHGISSLHDGRLCSPSVAGNGWLPDYALVHVLFVDWHVRCTGDLALAGELWPGVRAVLAHLTSLAEPDGLLGDRAASGGLVYLDNAAELNRHGRSAGLNALWVAGQRTAAGLAARLGHHREHKALEAGAQRCAQAFATAFTPPAGGDLLVDAQPATRQRYRGLELGPATGRWGGDSAEIEVWLLAAEDGPFPLHVAASTGLRARWDGGGADLPARPAWSVQPLHRPRLLTPDLRRGWNRLRIAVEANPLDWQLFLATGDGREPALAAGPDGDDPGACLVRDWHWSGERPLGPWRRAPLAAWAPPAASQTTHALAVYCRALPGADGTALLRAVLPADGYPRPMLGVRTPFFCRPVRDTAELDAWILPCNTPWSSFFLLAALFEHGLGGEALAWMRMAWGGMLARGATTCWEEWDDRASLCHAWGAAPLWFLHHEILGVRHETRCDGALLVRPDLHGLDWAEGRVAVGDDGDAVVEVAVRRDADGTRVRITAPDGVALSVDLSRLDRPQRVD